MTANSAPLHNDNIQVEQCPEKLNSLVVELEHYRRQSEWLSCVNNLHSRLAGAVDLTAMIEAFSIWLMPLVNHDLIAYKNPERERLHMFCSCHGPDRRHVMAAADKIFNNWADNEHSAEKAGEQYFIHSWQVETARDSVLLVVVRKEKEFLECESGLIDKGLRILKEPLQRALEYEDLYEQARRDSLTGLANRRVFDERIDSIIGSAQRNGYKVTLAGMDLDKFKNINDTFGHMVGDLVLQEVAKTMEKMIRNCDLLVRMGGDEFLLVMSNTSCDDAKILARRLCRAIEELDLPTAGRGQLGISIGLVEWDGKMNKDEWIQLADEALYKAKEEGRSRVCTMCL